jgi:hypothetical protein
VSGEPEKPPKIVVDDDWKERVQAEKEAIRQQKQPAAESIAPDKPQEHAAALPPASFSLLVSSLATQALAALGQLRDPSSKTPPKVHLPLAKHHIDLLGMLQEKTRGNLSSEESQMLENVLHELRMLFVAARQ